MLLQRLATGATGVKQARYRRRPTRGSEELVRACAQRNHIKPLRCGHPSIKARGSFPNGGHYRGVPLYAHVYNYATMLPPTFPNRVGFHVPEKACAYKLETFRSVLKLS